VIELSDAGGAVSTAAHAGLSAIVVTAPTGVILRIVWLFGIGDVDIAGAVRGQIGRVVEPCSASRPASLPLEPASPARVVTTSGFATTRTAGSVRALPTELVTTQLNESPLIAAVTDVSR